MVKEMRSQLQLASGKGLNDRNREGTEIRQQEEPGMKRWEERRIYFHGLIFCKES